MKILAGFTRALKKEKEANEKNSSQMETKNLAIRRVIMSLMDSTQHNEIRAPMAAHLIMEESNMIFSHEFSNIHLPQDVALLLGN